MNPPTKKDARIAGAWYLSLLLFGPLSLIYVPNKVIVRGNAAATAQSVLAHESIFRLAIAAELLGTVAFMFVAFALYRLLSSVNKDHAGLMVVFALMSVPLSFVGAGFNYGALKIFQGGEPAALGMLLVQLRSHMILVNEMFWGLWLLPLAALIIRSRFLPRWLGVWVLLAGFGWIAECLTPILIPDYVTVINRITSITSLGELALILWLVIMGIKVKPAVAAE